MALTKEEAQREVRLFTRDYPGAFELACRLRQTTVDLYPTRANEVPTTMKGGYSPKETIVDGRAYRGRLDVPLDNMANTRDLMQTLRHEVLGA